MEGYKTRREEDYDEIERKEYESIRNKLEYTYGNGYSTEINKAGLAVSKYIGYKYEGKEIAESFLEKDKVKYYVLKSYRNIVNSLNKQEENIEKELYETDLYRSIELLEETLKDYGYNIERESFKGTAEDYLEYIKIIKKYIEKGRYNSEEIRHTPLRPKNKDIL